MFVACLNAVLHRKLNIGAAHLSALCDDLGQRRMNGIPCGAPEIGTRLADARRPVSLKAVVKRFVGQK